jgi:hypothetical protein
MKSLHLIQVTILATGLSMVSFASIAFASDSSSTPSSTCTGGQCPPVSPLSPLGGNPNSTPNPNPSPAPCPASGCPQVPGLPHLGNPNPVVIPTGSGAQSNQNTSQSANSTIFNPTILTGASSNFSANFSENANRVRLNRCEYPVDSISGYGNGTISGANSGSGLSSNYSAFSGSVGVVYNHSFAGKGKELCQKDFALSTLTGTVDWCFLERTKYNWMQIPEGFAIDGDRKINASLLNTIRTCNSIQQPQQIVITPPPVVDQTPPPPVYVPPINPIPTPQLPAKN